MSSRKLTKRKLSRSSKNLLSELKDFRDFRKKTRVDEDSESGVPVLVNEFWTAKQRAANSLHEVSYRACFKPQLPAFFIDRLTSPGDVVYDPFMGRGTTLLESALSGRVPYGCDINPLSALLARPRLSPPMLSDVERRLEQIDFQDGKIERRDLLSFYHADTLRSICALRSYFMRRVKLGELDAIDRWLWMVSLNRLTGHSSGFFSVYTLPPNQAVSVASQRRINIKRDQKPPARDVAALIVKKSRQLLGDVTDEIRQSLKSVNKKAKIISQDSSRTGQIKSNSVQLAVTSPPFLDVVQYSSDNWLRAWFAGIAIDQIRLWQMSKVAQWEASMQKVLAELCRVAVPGGHVAFEVGEVRNGKLKLESAVLRAGAAAGLNPVLVLINRQKFTKTSNCWGIDNLRRGTNTNRVVLFEKSA